jgi:hypothetical protein
MLPQITCQATKAGNIVFDKTVYNTKCENNSNNEECDKPSNRPQVKANEIYLISSRMIKKTL